MERNFESKYQLGVSYTPNSPPDEGSLNPFGDFLLSQLLPEEMKDTIIGDIYEGLPEIIKARGSSRAFFWYWRQVTLSVAPYLGTRLVQLLHLRSAIQSTKATKNSVGNAPIGMPRSGARIRLIFLLPLVVLLSGVISERMFLQKAHSDYSDYIDLKKSIIKDIEWKTKPVEFLDRKYGVGSSKDITRMRLRMHLMNSVKDEESIYLLLSKTYYLKYRVKAADIKTQLDFYISKNKLKITSKTS